MKLYGYYRSSAAYRVRIALGLKGVARDDVPVHLLRDGGAQHSAAFRALNPAGSVPVLQLDDGSVLTQSLAIIEYLEERYPRPALLPQSFDARARVRSLALMIACDIHPLNNLRVRRYLQDPGGLTEAACDAWTRHWIEQGLEILETVLARDAQTGTFCYGDTPSLADCCLVPQLFSARRFNCRVDHLGTINRIAAACEALPAFAEARPERQVDAG